MGDRNLKLETVIMVSGQINRSSIANEDEAKWVPAQFNNAKTEF